MTLIIGHRGAGKTTFAKGLPGRVVDLDEEIERRTGVSVSEWLARGEVEFRATEARLVRDLANQGDLTVVAGAGFEGPIPENVHVVWIRRVTDSAGRSFLNRPRLNPNLSPFDEYRERFHVRDRRFREWAHEELVVPEGYHGGLENFFAGGWRVPYNLTLLPENFRTWDAFARKRMSWNIRRFELRDDLLDEEAIERALRTIPRDRLVFARRKKSGVAHEGLDIDWALELGEPPDGANIVSLHERGDDFESDLEIISRHSGLLKLAIEVQDFTELELGHKWWLEDPTRRAFLPRSPSGRWRWYRSLFGPLMPVHFVREGDGSSHDQPFLWQAILQPAFTKNFAAVLGQPVEHSRSPLEHLEFFNSRGMPFVAIAVDESEFPFAVKFLVELGLSYAAVTAPLKKAAWAIAGEVSPQARSSQAANTLFVRGSTVLAHNTDVLALDELKHELLPAPDVWLWGGGGIKGSIKSVWSQAKEIPARQGFNGGGEPDILIWATGRSRSFKWPSSQVRPKLILDLNYGDDSPGLEWAVRDNLPYQSGLAMFKKQARAQREFWLACEAGDRV